MKKVAGVRETVIVSERGQLTLPAALRRRLGILRGGPVLLEEKDGQMVLKPAMVVEIEMYSDAQIAEWDRSDTLTTAARAAVRKRLGNKP